MCSPLAFVVTSVTDRDEHVAAQADSSLSNWKDSLSRSLATHISVGSPIVPFHKSQDTLLHPGLNDQIQNTLFIEDPHVTGAFWGWFDWLPGSACADLDWSALVNHIGIHPLPATQPTLIGHTLYIKPRPSQFSVPHVPSCMHGNGEIFVCNIYLIKIVLLQRSHQPKTIIIE